MPRAAAFRATFDASIFSLNSPFITPATGRGWLTTLIAGARVIDAIERALRGPLESAGIAFEILAPRPRHRRVDLRRRWRDYADTIAGLRARRSHATPRQQPAWARRGEALAKEAAKISLILSRGQIWIAGGCRFAGEGQ